MTARAPFWDEAYRQDLRPFGGPSDEVIELMGRLPRASRVLDLGCGNGRHALPLALAGHRVTAVDVSSAATEALGREIGRATAAGHEPALEIVKADLAGFHPVGRYQLVIAHGVLHLLEPGARDNLIDAMRSCTVPGGWNVAAVFTDEIAPPDDMAPFCLGLFRPGELVERYGDWEIELVRAYVLEDEHPGSVRHRHPINKVVARRPV